MPGLKSVLMGALAAITMALSAAADPYSEVLFRQKHWVVSGVVFDDGSLACEAKVSGNADSFSLWVFDSGVLRMQFYSTAWQFSGGSADLRVQIDRRPDWSLTNAELYQNSVLFDLPGGNDSGRLLREIAAGNRLYLRTATNEDVMWYSLSGSRASMNALADCSDRLGRSSGNPFR